MPIQIGQPPGHDFDEPLGLLSDRRNSEGAFDACLRSLNRRGPKTSVESAVGLVR